MNMLVHRSSTRRKACTACVRAKRRCDLGFPRCIRCTDRNLACDYTTPSKSAKGSQQVIHQRFADVEVQQTHKAIPVTSRMDIGLKIGVENILNLGPINSIPFPERTVLKQDQVDFCISQFKACIPQLVQQNRSPFIHPDSYQHMPPVIYQDLLGVSAMYSQKTPQSQTVMFSMLDSRVSSLLTASRSSCWSIKDYLVGVQSLIMYQIIRLFDGDIRQRANAEKHLTLLESWTIRLQSMGNNYQHDDTSPESLYEHWVLIESMRRTIIMSVMLQAMYSILKDGFCTSVPLLGTLPVSVDGSLWNVPEEVWWQATLGLGSDLLTYQEFVNEWSGGKSFNTDAYETILLAACKHNLRPPSLQLD